MFFFRWSSLMAMGFAFAASSMSGQLKENDFTKRVGGSIGKMHRFSGKRFIGDVQAKYDRRVHVSRLPELMTPLGGIRFPTKTSAPLYQTPMSLDKLGYGSAGLTKKVPFSGRVASQVGLGVREPAAASIDFRDNYYAELHSRVDEWMEKVNNMSMQDVNRYNFRKGRSSEPGLPVQRAGSQAAPRTGEGSVEAPAVKLGAEAPAQRQKWSIGPMRTVKQVGGSPVSNTNRPVGNSVVSGASPTKANSGSVLPRPRSAPRPSGGLLPRLGPRKVSVSVGGGPGVPPKQ